MPEILEKTEQAVQPGEKQIEEKAGEVTDGVDTAATEEDGNGFSIEDIGSDKGPEADDGVLKLDGVSEKAQERLNKKISNAIKERNIAQDEARKAIARAAELEAAAAIPKEKPLAPLERNFADDSEYQAAMDKYQTDIITYNNMVRTVETQKIEDVNRVRVNDDRLLVQMDELQKKFPGVNVEEAISAVADVNGFGNAAPYIHNSEHNARIALYLAKNPDELARMTALNDAGAINREIGKLEERFSSVRKKTTNAPKSLDTVKGLDSIVVKDLSKIKDDDEWYREWKKQKEVAMKQANNN